MGTGGRTVGGVGGAVRGGGKMVCIFSFSPSTVTVYVHASHCGVTYLNYFVVVVCRILFSQYLAHCISY